MLRIDLTSKHVNARLLPQWCNMLWQGMFPLPYLLKTKNVKYGSWQLCLLKTCESQKRGYVKYTQLLIEK
jgi:hypothetical protein